MLPLPLMPTYEPYIYKPVPIKECVACLILFSLVVNNSSPSMHVPSADARPNRAGRRNLAKVNPTERQLLPAINVSFSQGHGLDVLSGNRFGEGSGPRDRVSCQRKWTSAPLVSSPVGTEHRVVCFASLTAQFGRRLAVYLADKEIGSGRHCHRLAGCPPVLYETRQRDGDTEDVRRIETNMFF